MRPDSVRRRAEEPLLLPLLVRREALDLRHAARGLRGRRRLAPLERPRGDRDESAGLEVELLVEDEVLGAVGEGHHPLQRHVVLVEEALRRPHELLGDLLVLVGRQDGHGTEQPERSPAHRDGDADDLALVLLGDEAPPRLHEPAVVHVLGAPEHLPRPGAQLALEEVAEGRLDDLAHPREVALLDPPDLDHRAASDSLRGRVTGPRADSPQAATRGASTRWWRGPIPSRRAGALTSAPSGAPVVTRRRALIRAS